MYAINHDPQINRLGNTPQTSPAQGEVLQETIGVSLLDDLNQQLTDIAHTMKSRLNEKKALREEITWLDQFASRPVEKTSQGDKGHAITDKEYAQLMENGYQNLEFVKRKDGVGYLMLQGPLTNEIENKREGLAGLNAQSEMTMITIQSLVDQRKNAMTMLSNLVASKSELLMSIARNLRN